MTTQTGEIVSINSSQRRCKKKVPVDTARLIEQFGLAGDIHAGQNNKRQVSFLSFESIQNHKICPKIIKENNQFLPGDFGENITMKGVDFLCLQLENKIKIGTDVVLEISKIGRNCCNWKCPLNHRREGGCFILREGMFGYVIKGGIIKKGDRISVSS